MPSYSLDDTITALATPPGEGGIGVIRLAGPEAFTITRRMVNPVKKNIAFPFPTHMCVLCDLLDSEERILDRVLVTRFEEGRSYTGDEQVEISCHGGPALLQTILDRILREGARMAERGEFTRRAFLNGRMDLTQAEAVLDLIRTRSREGVVVAAAELTGRLSQEIEAIRQCLVTALTRLELAVDFPEDELPQSNTEAILLPLKEAENLLKNLLENADRGQLVSNGVKTVIAGRPNVGKSSLYNALTGNARAIVTEHPGTTRDLLETTLEIGGVAFVLMDTAGLRETDHVIESVGVALACEALKEADVLILVFDSSSPLTEEDLLLLEETKDRNRLIVMNKSDLARQAAPVEGEIFISAQTTIGIDSLQKRLLSMTVGEDLHGETLLTRERHVQGLRSCRDAVGRALLSIQDGEECSALEVRAALDSLSALVGETTTDEILDKIFGEFCIGK